MKRQSEETIMNYDYSKLFDNPQLSDCTIILVAKSGGSLMSSSPPSSHSSRTPKKSSNRLPEGEFYEEDIVSSPSPSNTERSHQTQKKLHVSKFALACQSTYFYELFLKQPANEITIEVESPKEIDYFIDVVRCIYSVSIETQASDLVEMFQSAVQYNVRCAIEKCFQQLKSELTLASTCKILELSDKILLSGGSGGAGEHLGELLNKSKSFLVNNYGNLIASVQKEDFLELTYRAFSSLLESEQVTMDSENTLLYAILIWLNHKSDRKQHLESLLSHVRFPQLRPYYLLSVQLLLRDYPPESTKFVNKLFNEAMEFKVGGAEWIKCRNGSAEIPPRFETRPNNITTNVGSPNNPFEITHKFTGVSRWNIDNPQWSSIYFSNGYNLHFYLSKTKDFPSNIGIFIHLFNKLIEGEEFCLPITCTIYLGNQNSGWDKMKPFTSTFRRKSKGLTIDINPAEHLQGDSITVKLEIIFS